MTQAKPPQKPTASRRAVIAAGLGAAGAGALNLPREAPAQEKTPADAGTSSLTFSEVPHGLDNTHAVAPGHNLQILLRWGDAIVDGAPAWNVAAQSGAAQALQFGYDNDFIAFKPLPEGSNSSTHGLLCVNHESARNQLMFPGFTSRKVNDQTKELMDVEMAAHGHTIVEVELKDGLWAVVAKSGYNRRITASTEMDIAGPAMGHARMMTRDDPKGVLALGTLGNCAGGETPWGTVLTGEENFHYYFGGDPRSTKEAANHLLYGLGNDLFHGWHLHYARFSVAQEPHEPNRFGWVVEIDPYDPKARPAKRTALGRLKHEGAGCVLNADGRVVVYLGDDEYFQHVYKFVSRGTVDRSDRKRNWGLLDDGTLFAARFNDDQSVTWLPLVWGTGPLTAANGFANQADVLIDTRRAAALLGATAMDRPEDIEVNRVTNTVFVALTKNARRGDEKVDAANPRAKNRWGHIMEMVPADGDHAAATARWQILLLAGDPAEPGTKAQYHSGVSAAGWLTNPDNFTVDPKGRVWISTDGSNDFGFADGLWATDVVGQGRALTKAFFRCPIGGELTGPTFTPDGTTLFCSVQHPGDDGKSNFVDPVTRWPDFKEGVPPRPSLIAIRAQDGKPIG